ncbi:hypothetical protein BAU15_00255 [Enterococcus sp. JM4C]|uniref:DUF3013 family protein n=1 Tax=Candidatus Enterococcus huntleyi TaxID=1857217 RepID=UPI00137A96BF|nr:DUF3013 family protein [Enterococcus sp. JM4C]KAF1299112.1 hypothetical protein BAU15_00255 [Enterococcus sp. JM4C]
MKKQSMLTYLDERINKVITEYDVAIDWDKGNHTIEVVVRLFGENKSQAAIDDVQGVASEEEIIEFEDGVLFYNPEKSKVSADDFLAIVPFEGKKGCSKATINGVVDYLNEVLDQGQSDLLDFLADDSEDAVFELVWAEDKLAAHIAQYEGKDGAEYLAYPSY